MHHARSRLAVATVATLLLAACSGTADPTAEVATPTATSDAAERMSPSPAATSPAPSPDEPTSDAAADRDGGTPAAADTPSSAAPDDLGRIAFDGRGEDVAAVCDTTGRTSVSYGTAGRVEIGRVDGEIISMTTYGDAGDITTTSDVRQDLSADGLRSYRGEFTTSLGDSTIAVTIPTNVRSCAEDELPAPPGALSGGQATVLLGYGDTQRLFPDGTVCREDDQRLEVVYGESGDRMGVVLADRTLIDVDGTGAGASTYSAEQASGDGTTVYRAPDVAPQATSRGFSSVEITVPSADDQVPTC